MVKKHTTPSKATHSQGTRLPKGHSAFNLPAPQGGAFDGAQLNSPMGMGGPSLAPGRPMPDGAGAPGGPM
jgi:hypothetical protein